MDQFTFHGELFEIRASIFDALAESGFIWLSNFGAIDLQHDVYGLEVTGIPSESEAKSIERILCRLLPDWSHVRTFYESQNIGELGWKIMISRDREKFDEPLSETTSGPYGIRRLLWHVWDILANGIRRGH